MRNTTSPGQRPGQPSIVPALCVGAAGYAGILFVAARWMMAA